MYESFPHTSSAEKANESWNLGLKTPFTIMPAERFWIYGLNEFPFSLNYMTSVSVFSTNFWIWSNFFLFLMVARMSKHYNGCFLIIPKHSCISQFQDDQNLFCLLILNINRYSTIVPSTKWSMHTILNW